MDIGTFNVNAKAIPIHKGDNPFRMGNPGFRQKCHLSFRTNTIPFRIVKFFLDGCIQKYRFIVLSQKLLGFGRFKFYYFQLRRNHNLFSFSSKKYIAMIKPVTRLMTVVAKFDNMFEKLFNDSLYHRSHFDRNFEYRTSHPISHRLPSYSTN